MRNLSKVLALVLSLAFVLTMFASAAPFIVPVGDKVVYTDAEAFDAAAGKEAVRILTALGIVKGYPEGDFQPAGDVTRAEFAKMVALAKTGKTVDDDADFNFYDTQVVLPFTDVADSDWFKGYVNYAYLNFILAGYGDGTLRPKNNVTGVEAVKMVLVALGYDPKLEGLEGADWMRNTMTLAGKTNLLANLSDENMYEALDREATAILIWNALNEKTVAYNNGYIYFTGKTLAEASAFEGVEIAKPVDKSSVKLTADGEYYIDGVKVSYEDAKAALEDAKKSSAPVEEKNGAIYFYSYDVYKVKAVDGNKLTLWGKGDVTVADAADIAADDFIVLWSSTLGNKGINYAKELEVVTGKVTAYTINSNDGNGIGITEAGGKYTINGKQYEFGSLADEFDNTLKGLKDESDYFEELLGIGTAAVADAEFTFIVDGSYIVAVFVNENTYWENYAIVIGSDPVDRTLGMQHIRLLTDDNEYKDFYVASVDGNQIYNHIVSGSIVPNWPSVNELIRYEDLGNNKIAIYTTAYANAVSEVLSNATGATNRIGDLVYNKVSRNWDGYDITTEAIPQRETTFVWENGVVFVSYQMPLSGVVAPVAVAANGGAWYWRAYRYDEFQPAQWDNICNNRFFCDDVTVVCADSLNNNITLKAAAISFNAPSVLLPGLPLRADQIWGTVMSVTSIAETVEEGVQKFIYKFDILQPWSTASTAITVYADHRLATVTKGDIYKLFIDEDGVCRRFEIAKTAQAFQPQYWNNYLELGYWNVTNAAWNDTYNGWFLTIKAPSVASGFFQVVSATYFMPADADAYFVENLFAANVAPVDYVNEIGSYGIASLINDKSWEIFADVDLSTNTINSIWFNKNAGVAGGPALYEFDTTIDVTYNDGNETVTYAIESFDDVTFYSALNSATAVPTANKTLTVAAKPYELKAPIGQNVPVTLVVELNENGGWYVKDIKGYSWTCYGAAGLANVTAASFDQWNSTNYTLTIPANPTGSHIVYNYATNVDLVWFRENQNLTKVLFTPDTTAVTGGVSLEPNANSAALELEKLDFDPDRNDHPNEWAAYDYELVYVMVRSSVSANTTWVAPNPAAAPNTAEMIVPVDLDVTDAGVKVGSNSVELFPYVSSSSVAAGAPNLWS